MRIGMIATIVATFGLALSASVYAKGDSKALHTMSNLKSACKADIQKQCKDVTPGEGRIAACLNSKEDKLSDKCKTAWTSTKERVSKKMDKADVKFRQECGNDIQKYCADVPSGKGRLMDCLDKHEDDLSNSCKNFQAKLQERMAELLG